MGTHAAPKRRKRTYEDDEFAKAAGRMLTALEKRASVNPDALAYLLTLRSETDQAITRAGHALTPAGGGQFSLGELAQFMTYNGHKMSRQAAQQRWGAASIAAKLGMPRIADRINNVVRLADFRAARATKSANQLADDAAKAV
jgi:hypothetical protein